MEINKILSIIFAVVFILFLPGFIWTFVFFGLKKIDNIERFALSFALSLALVPLLVFYGNLAGIPINKVNVLVTVLFLCSLGGLIILGKHYLNQIHIHKNKK